MLNRTIRLLVVEDNAPYLYLIQKAFSLRQEQIRWELTVATDGEQAVRVLFEEKETNTPLPDLILLDWDLPKITGAEVLDRLKQHESLRKIPVLIFSASDADDDIHWAYGAHANGYITKPEGKRPVGDHCGDHRAILDYRCAAAESRPLRVIALCSR